MAMKNALFLLLLLWFPFLNVAAAHDYLDALSKSLLFFEGQRSGRLPPNQRLAWRRDSALADGYQGGVDLLGGYYDAGDNVKFGFPMAFTTTMLSWSVIEFGNLMPPAELYAAMDAIRWGTAYLLKTIAQPGRIFVQVGDPIADHNCWERPEDMDTVRTVYSVDASSPGSDVAGETAAALAAASLVFRSTDPSYSQQLLQNAIRTFEFADTYKGAYSDNPGIKAGACPFYCDFDGYQDELLWGAAWLRRASQNDSYLSYIQNNGKTLGADDNINEFGWDNKHAGLNVLVSKEFLEGQVMSLQSYKASADSFMCTLIPESSSSHIQYTPGGMIYKPGGSNMQHVTSISFLLLTYADYLSRSFQTVNCGSVSVGPASLRSQARKQESKGTFGNLTWERREGICGSTGFKAHHPSIKHHIFPLLPLYSNHFSYQLLSNKPIYSNFTSIISYQSHNFQNIPFSTPTKYHISHNFYIPKRPLISVVIL